MATGSKHKRWTQMPFTKENGKDRKILSCPTCGSENHFRVFLQRPLRRTGTKHRIAAYAECQGTKGNPCGDITRISAGWAK